MTTAETAAPESPAVPAVPAAGWRVIARKEFADHVRSVRLLIVVAVLALSAVGAVAAAAGTVQGAATDASRDPSIFLRLFVIPIGDSPFAFETLVTLIGPLLGIAFGFDAINGERSERTLPRLVSQPIYRDDVINGKFAAGLLTIGVVVTAVTVLTGAVGVLRLGVTPSPAEFGRLAAWLVATIVYIALWLAFAIACSVYLRRAATSALVALAVWIVLSLFATFLVGLIADTLAPVPQQPTLQEVQANTDVQQWLGAVVPGSVYQDVTSVLLTPEVRTVGFSLTAFDPRALPSSLSLATSLSLVWPQAVGMVAATVAIFALAYMRFMREEVRA